MSDPNALAAAFAARDLSFAFSPHFSLGELLHSDDALKAGIVNYPAGAAQPLIDGLQVVTNLQRLVAELLEPIRVGIDRPIRVSSGYRCSALNALEHGVHDSQHLFGLAADIEALDLDNYGLATWINDRAAAGRLPVDQVILEGHHADKPASGWVHVSIAAPGAAPRRQALTMHDGNYLPGLVQLA